MARLLALAAVVICSSFFAATAQPPPLPPYTNYTVGDAAGWFFNATTNTSSANYSTWAANLTFDLGDYLIFRTNTNQTVIQTYNQTTYEICSIDDDSSDETTVYLAGEEMGRPAVVAVPLTVVGKNFFFSDADDGIQCEGGMRFEIFVGQGRGLPPSLNQPPPPPPASPPPEETPPSEVATTNQGETFYNGASKVGFGMGISVLLLLFSAVLLPPLP